MSKDKEKMTKEEKIEKATELIEDLKATELSDEEMEEVAAGAGTTACKQRGPVVKECNEAGEDGGGAIGMCWWQRENL